MRGASTLPVREGFPSVAPPHCGRGREAKSSPCSSPAYACQTKVRSASTRERRRVPRPESAAMQEASSLWALVQGDPVFMRRVIGSPALFWVAPVEDKVVEKLVDETSVERT